MPDLDKIIDDAVENPIVSGAADDIAKDLTNALIGELTLIPDPGVPNQNVWSTKKEAQQDQIIRRLKDRVRAIVTSTLGEILAAGNPAAKAKLKDVKFGGDKITAGLEVDGNCKERHALADFAFRGGYVAVIMPDDLDGYFASMDEITANKDQPDLPLEKPAEDKGSAVDDAKPDDEPPADDPGPVADANGDPEAVEPSGVDIELFGALQHNNINVPLDVVQVWNSEFREAAWKWIEAAEAGDSSNIPAFMHEYVDAAGTEPDDDEKPIEKMTQPELVKFALQLANAIGEADIKPSQMSRKNKADLREYINFAQKKLAAQADTPEIPSETPSGDPEKAQQIVDDVIIVLGLTIPLDDTSAWPEKQQDEVIEYIRTIRGGTLPEQIPSVLGPYMGDGEN